MNDLKQYLSIEWRTRYFAHVLFFLFISSVAVFGIIIGTNRQVEKSKSPQSRANPFDGIVLEGKGIMVYDAVNRNEIFSINPDLPMALASLTKVLTAIVAEREIDDEKKIEITKEFLEAEGDSNLLVGDTWRAYDLRDFALLTSSNDGALALAAISGGETKFVEEMNEMAGEIGLSNSKFFNEHGLDRGAGSVTGGAYGSARDMALLFEYTLKNYPKILEATRYKNLTFMSNAHIYPAENTNAAVNQIPNLLASKTGYTDLAGGNLVIAFDAGLNRPIIISILGSTAEGRFGDALKLVDATMKYIHDN